MLSLNLSDFAEPQKTHELAKPVNKLWCAKPEFSFQSLRLTNQSYLKMLTLTEDILHNEFWHFWHLKTGISLVWVFSQSSIATFTYVKHLNMYSTTAQDTTCTMHISGLLVQFVFKEKLMALEEHVICTCNEMEKPPWIPWCGGVSWFACLLHLLLSCLYNSIVSIILSSWL